MQFSPAPHPDRASTLGGAGALAQALAARICHDLVSPVGAVVNGVDLVAEIGAAEAGEEIGLIAASARRAAALLEFHRLAFGPAGADSPAVARSVLLRTLSGVFDGRRIALSVAGGEGPALSRPAARAAALGCLCARGLVGLRGTVGIRLAEAGDLPMEFVATTDAGASGAVPTQGMVARLQGRHDAAPEPREVEFALLPIAAAQAGWDLSVEGGGGTDPVRLTLAVAAGAR